MARSRSAIGLIILGLVVVWIATAIAIEMVLAVPVRSVSGQSATPGPEVVRESRFEIADAAVVAEVVQQVVSFPPGAWTSPHSHGGQAINLVMEGEVTFRRGEEEQEYTVGRAWSDPTGDVHAAGNETGAPAHLLTNFLLPAGATQTTVYGESKLEPKVTYQARYPVTPLPADADVVQQAADFEPGAWTGLIKHAGQAAHIVVFGEITYRGGGQERVYKAGEAWGDVAGHAYEAGNMGSERSRLFTTVLLPDGSELTEQADASDVAPVPPAQSSDQENSGTGSTVLTAAVAAAVLALAGVGLLLLRRSRSTT